MCRGFGGLRLGLLGLGFELVYGEEGGEEIERG